MGGCFCFITYALFLVPYESHSSSAVGSIIRLVLVTIIEEITNCHTHTELVLASLIIPLTRRILDALVVQSPIKPEMSLPRLLRRRTFRRVFNWILRFVLLVRRTCSLLKVEYIYPVISLFSLTSSLF